MGIDIPIQWLSLLLFGGLGLPMAFCTGSLATIFLYLFGTSAVLNMMPSRIFPFMTDYQLSAVPLFIFIGTMFVTGVRFAADAVNAREVSFTEWGIQYWPVKLMIPIGAALLLLQGLAKLLKDVLFVARRGA